MEDITTIEQELANIEIIDPYSKYYTGQGLYENTKKEKIKELSDDEFNNINKDLVNHFDIYGDYKAYN